MRANWILNFFTLTDDLYLVVTEIEKSLISQILALEEQGLSDTKYYESLTSYIADKHAVKGEDA